MNTVINRLVYTITSTRSRLKEPTRSTCLCAMRSYRRGLKVHDRDELPSCGGFANYIVNDAVSKRVRLLPSRTFAFGFLLTNQSVARCRSRTYDECNWLHF